MKQFSRFLAIILLFSLLTVPSVMAQSPKIVDDADLLTDWQEQDLEVKAQALADQYDIDVVIVTVYSLDGKSSEAYADDYFDYNGYGIGSNYSGVLFLLSMEYRDWAISTCGDGIYALTDSGIQSVFSACAGFLSNDSYYEAFDAYLNALEPFFIGFQNGAPIDKPQGNYTGPGSFEIGTQDEIIYYPVNSKPSLFQIISKLFISLIAGIVVAAIAVSIMTSSMKTFRKQKNATNYLQPGTFNLTRRSDRFLYTRTTRRLIQDESSGHSSGGSRSFRGGSSVHRSSSGRSHGGGHGKF